jgi:hypothetical protein
LIFAFIDGLAFKALKLGCVALKLKVTAWVIQDK